MYHTKSLLVALLLFTGGLTLSAQEYSSAVGLRLGYPVSITYKTFVSETAAVEGFIGFSRPRFQEVGTVSGVGSVSLNLAYQVHNDIADVAGLQWYIGGGPGVQFVTFDNDFDIDAQFRFSLSGYLGLQYTLSDAPISFSVDWVPTFFVGGDKDFEYRNFDMAYGGIAVRYVLGR